MDTKRAILAELNYTQAAFIVAGIQQHYPTTRVWHEITGYTAPDGDEHTVYTDADTPRVGLLRALAQGVCFTLAQLPTDTACDCLDAHNPNPTEDDDPEQLVLAAQEHLDAAITYLQEYCNREGDEQTRAYILDHLRIMAHADHGFCSRDLNLDEVLADLDKDTDDDPDTE